eukprot:1159863-Pelagomonas_calceolata.AAC.9
MALPDPRDWQNGAGVVQWSHEGDLCVCVCASSWQTNIIGTTHLSHEGEATQLVPDGGSIKAA